MHTTPTEKDIAASCGYTEVDRWKAVAGNLAVVLALLATDPRLDEETRETCRTVYRRQLIAHGLATEDRKPVAEFCSTEE